MTGIILAFAGGGYTSAPVNTVAPTISGTAGAGQTLTSSTGTWSAAPAPTFTYQWQRGTTNISGATSSSYTIVGADIGNTLRCVVTATNTVGSSSANSANTSTVAAPTIGQAIGGGNYIGQSGGNYLIAAPSSGGQNSSIRWKTTASDTPGTSSLSDGLSNSNAMNNASHPAAQFCRGLTIAGYTDWYMPAYNELLVMYTNQAGLGFYDGPIPYWASTQYDSASGYIKYFDGGSRQDFNKTNTIYVRAVRRL